MTCISKYIYLDLLLFLSWYQSDTDMQKMIYGFSDNWSNYWCNTTCWSLQLSLVQCFVVTTNIHKYIKPIVQSVTWITCVLEYNLPTEVRTFSWCCGKFDNGWNEPRFEIYVSSTSVYLSLCAFKHEGCSSRTT